MKPAHSRKTPQRNQDDSFSSDSAMRNDSHAVDSIVHRHLNVLTLLAILVLFYVASSLILPILVASFLALFSSPLVRALRRLGIPKTLGAAMVIIGLTCAVTLAISMLINPASDWINRLPSLSSQLGSQIETVSESIDSIRDRVLPESERNADQGESDVAESMNGPLLSLFSLVAQSTLDAVIQLLMVIVITYFFLVYGYGVMKRIIGLFPNRNDKENVLEITDQLQQDLSRYVLTISIINTGLGIAVWLALSIIGVKDALLWGALAGIFNFAPYLGLLIMTGILVLVGFTEFQQLSMALLVPACFLVINLLESQLITPMALGKKFNLNPLIVVIWLLIWGWIWGAVGVLIAVPMLMALKIAAQRLRFLSPVKTVLGD